MAGSYANKQPVHDKIADTMQVINNNVAVTVGKVWLKILVSRLESKVFCVLESASSNQ